MKFQIGDIVYNTTTREEGRVVRIADLTGYGIVYIVSVVPNPIWGATAKEAIWERSEVGKRSQSSKFLSDFSQWI
jgi:hypothetical protein